jgi:hypothetical protein
MISRINRIGLAAAAAIAFGAMGQSTSSALPVDTSLAALAANDSAVEQVARRKVRHFRYRYARPYGAPRYYAYGPSHYYYGAPYGYWGGGYSGPYYRPYGYWGPRYYRRPAITFSFGFGPSRGWW